VRVGSLIRSGRGEYHYDERAWEALVQVYHLLLELAAEGRTAEESLEGEPQKLLGTPDTQTAPYDE
jgi:hypothetical protein